MIAIVIREHPTSQQIVMKGHSGSLYGTAHQSPILIELGVGMTRFKFSCIELSRSILKPVCYVDTIAKCKPHHFKRSRNKLAFCYITCCSARV